MATLVDRLFNPNRLCRRIGPQGPLPNSREVLKSTLEMALPSIAEAFLIAIVTMLNSYMVSGLGDYAISAVGLTTQPRFVLLAPFIAMNIAVSSLIARRKGENRLDEASKVLQQAVFVAILLTAGLTVVGYLVADPALRLMGSQPDSHADAVIYFRITVLGMIFNVLTLTINAAQRGVGNTRIAMRTNLVANLVNVAVNLLLIEGRLGFPRLEVTGAAIGTVLGSVVACFMALWSVSRTGSVLQLVKGFRFRFDRVILQSMLKLSVPTFCEQIFVRIGFIMYFTLIARLGTTANAAHHIGSNFINLSFSLADGLSVACIALVGRSLGAKRKDLALIYSSTCQRLGLGCSFLVAAIYIPFGRFLYALFSDNPEVQNYGTQLMPVISAIVFCQITMIIFISCLRAAGDVKFVAVMGFVCIGIIRPLSAYLLCYTAGLGLVGAWLGMGIDQSIRLVLAYIRYRRGKWMDIKI